MSSDKLRFIPALSICQPWAWAITEGPKDIENRKWSTNYRGPLLIHASKSRARLDQVLNDGTPVRHDRLVYGAIVGMADLHDVLTCTSQVAESFGDNKFFEGPVLWVLRHRTAFKQPIPYRGQLFLFNVPIESLRSCEQEIYNWFLKGLTDGGK